MRKQIQVVGAVILEDGKVLCAQRGPAGSLGGKWEFPGGKIEPNESPRQALEREIDEELMCQIQVDEEVTTTTYEYDFATIILTTFFCKLLGGKPQLTEHSAVTWLPPEKLHELDWAPADIPAVELVQEQLAA